MDSQINLIVIIIGVSIGAYIFLRAPLRGVMYIVAFQKLIDILWFVSVNVGTRLSIQIILYSVIPIGLIFVLLQKVTEKNTLYLKAPMVSLLIVFGLYFTWQFIRSPLLMVVLPSYFKAVGPFLIFGAGWFYFDNEKKFDEFAKLYVFSFIIPFIGWFLQYTNIFSISSLGVKHQEFVSAGFEEEVYRYTGFYNDPHSQAYPLATVIPLCLYMLKNDRASQIAKSGFMLVFLMAIPIFATGYSRSTLGAIFFGIIVWLVFSRQYVMLLLVGAVGLTSLLYVEFFQKLFSDLFVSYESGVLSASYSGRTGFWKIVLDAFDKLSIPEKFLGMGLGSHMLTSPYFFNAETGGYGSAHSDFLEYLYEMGYLGLGMLHVIMILVVIKSVKNIKRCEKYNIGFSLKGKYVTILPIVAFFFAIESVAWPSRAPSVTWPIWFIAGFAFKHPLFYVAQAQINSRLQQNYVKVNPMLMPA